jgi:phosphoglycerate kinase
LFEKPEFQAGTYQLARAIGRCRAFTLAGGGETVQAIQELSLAKKFSFVSTGGGAMLSFLAGEKLPGLKALGYYSK